MVAGLPPLSGFVGKLAMLSALLDARSPGRRPAWTLFALLIASGLLATIALTRVGIRHFWTRAGPRRRRACAWSNALPIAVLLTACGCALVLQAEPVLRYTRATADALHAAGALHRRRCMSARPLPQPTLGARAMKRWLPAPLLSLACSRGWLLLTRSRQPAARRCWPRWWRVALPLLIAPLRPRPGRCATSGVLVRLIARVGVDVVRSAHRGRAAACCARAAGRRAAPSWSCRWSCATHTRWRRWR